MCCCADALPSRKKSGSACSQKQRFPCARSCAASQMRSQATKTVAVLAPKFNDAHVHAHVLHCRCAPKPQKRDSACLQKTTMPMCTLMCCCADALPSHKNSGSACSQKTTMPMCTHMCCCADALPSHKNSDGACSQKTTTPMRMHMCCCAGALPSHKNSGSACSQKTTMPMRTLMYCCAGDCVAPWQC